ncbi:MAG: insulinase family protein [Chlorobiaceae bacterium]|nr:insulinase family protein [Chlorobiaceae bacterium]MBA4310293.1 insulinase family protein [Chlorobiaceae bacterium]
MNNFKITKLQNNVTLISENLPYVQSFSLGFWFNVGTRDESFEENGISHFYEHMLFKGTINRSSKKISEEIESLGGYLNAFTSKEQICFYGRGLAKNVEKTFEVISDMIQNPLFKETDIKKESRVVIDELNDINDNPEDLIFDKFEEVLYKGKSLAQPIIGREEVIKNFSRQQLIEFHENKIKFNQPLIVASGNIDHDFLCSLAEKYFKKNLNPLHVRENLILNNSSTELIVDKEIQQVYCIVGKASYGYNDERRIPLNLLSNIIGDGSSSRIFQQIREKHGIAYQINSFVNSYYDTSVFGIYFSTSEKQLDKVLRLISTEFKKLIDTNVSKKELMRVKEYIKGSITLGLENTTNRMIRAANSYLYFGRVISIDEIISQIDIVNEEQIQQISSELFDEKNMTKVIIKSNSKLIKKAA